MEAQNAQKMSYADLLALYDKLEADKKTLVTRIKELEENKKRNNTISYKCRAKGELYDTTDKEGKPIKGVGKGNLLMYGFQRFPISLYRSQATKLLEEVKSGRFEAALETFKDKLTDEK